MLQNLRLSTLVNLLFSTTLILAALSPPTQAVDIETIRDSSGRPIFQLLYYDPARDDGDDDDKAWFVSQKEIRESIALGAEAWIDVIGKYVKNTEPARISVFGEKNENNDAAGSETVILPNGDSSFSSLGAYLITGSDIPPKDDPNHAFFFVGDWPSRGGISSYANLPISALPKNGNLLNTGVIFYHELAHAMGLMAVTKPQKNGYQAFSPVINSFTEHLVDSRGVAAKAGQYIFESTDDAIEAFKKGIISNPNDAFITENNTLFFVGDHLSDVLQGAYGNKVLIQGWEPDENGIWEPDFSHIEFRNSLMSHQSYRNTGIFSEAELAIMQDIGYTLDRRNHYGFSLYGSGQTITNTNGYFARNDAGTAYLEGVHNPTANGVGLHIFGDDNTVVQAADILSSGYGALGVRVDGRDNHLTIGRNTTIETTGTDAFGVAVTYGKNHTLNHRGVIVATGEGGRGVSYDFGSNLMSDTDEYHGSHIRTYVDYNKDPEGNVWGKYLLDDMLDGALVNRFDLSGVIIADKDEDAIHIASNAHVKTINILNGAALQGNITSHWNPDVTPGHKHSLQVTADADYADFITNLTFGLAQDADGNALSGADENFRMRYDGDITGPDSLAMTIAGGALHYGGKAEVISLTNQEGATLSGSCTFTIAPLSGSGTFAIAALNRSFFPGRDSYDNNFVNRGKLVPGGASETGTMSIVLGQRAEFINTGTVQIGFTADGDHSVLAISGNGSNTASFNGTTELAALPNYYASGENITFTVDELIQVDGGIVSSGKNSVTASSFSPTLDFIAGDVQGGTVTVTASRSADSYAQFGNDDATRGVGRELWRISYSDMPDSFRNVLVGLDAAGDAKGVERGLNQLLPHFANSAATRSLDNQRVLNSALLGRLLPGFSAASCSPGGDDREIGGGLRAFATAIGGGGRQSARGYASPGYSYWSAGVLTGLEWRNSDLVLGMHLAANHWKQRGSNSSDDRFRTNAFSFGLHAAAHPNNWNGGHLFALVRGTVENNRMDRNIRLVTGSSRNHSSWTGFSGSAVLGGGFDFECGTFRFGPMAGLDYASTHRRSVTESGAFGVLDIEAETYHSLRMIAGMRLSGLIGRKTTFSASAQWNHELLTKMGDTKAKFAHVGIESFSTRARYPGRDSLSARLGIDRALTDRTSVALETGGEFFRKGYASVWGSASISWSF